MDRNAWDNGSPKSAWLDALWFVDNNGRFVHHRHSIFCLCTLHKTLNVVMMRCQFTHNALGAAPNNAGQVAGCFARGLLVGAAGAVAVSGIAVGAVTLGAPVAAVTIAVGAVAAITGGITGAQSILNVVHGNYAAAAYGSGTLVGGVVAGGLNAANTVFGLTGEYGTPFTDVSNEASMNVYQNPGQSYGSALVAASGQGPTQGGASLATGTIGSALSWLGGAGCN
jgi:hypothetical protein